jgi:hypothetical protein
MAFTRRNFVIQGRKTQGHAEEKSLDNSERRVSINYLGLELLVITKRFQP